MFGLRPSRAWQQLHHPTQPALPIAVLTPATVVWACPVSVHVMLWAAGKQAITYSASLGGYTVLSGPTKAVDPVEIMKQCIVEHEDESVTPFSLPPNTHAHSVSCRLSLHDPGSIGQHTCMHLLCDTPATLLCTSLHVWRSAPWVA